MITVLLIVNVSSPYLLFSTYNIWSVLLSIYQFHPPCYLNKDEGIRYFENQYFLLDHSYPTLSQCYVLS